METVKDLEGNIRNLIGLQVCDNKIRHIQDSKKEGPREIDRLKRDLEAVENQILQELSRLEELRRERRETEQNIEEIENRIDKSNIKLSSIKSNKEYRAVLKEIDDLKREKSILEESLIEKMEQVEALEKDSSSSQAMKTELGDKFEADRERVLKELEALNQDLERLEEERMRFHRTIDEELLIKYQSLVKHKQGIAVSPVIKGVCQTCHMGIPPQKFNELIRGDTLMVCPNCGRIIYWGEDERYVEAPQMGDSA